MRFPVLPALAVVAAALAASTPPSAYGQGIFRGLGDLPGGEFTSYATDVSADGLTVIGASTSGDGHEAFRWTQADGLQSLDNLLGGSVWSKATAVSADGSVIVGAGTGASGLEPVRWVSGAAPTGLGSLGGAGGSRATGVAADGSAIVGWQPYGAYLDEAAWQWTSGTGVTQLPAPTTRAQALAVSGDGSIVVGNGGAWQNPQALRWVGGASPLTLENSTDIAWSDALGISADGSTIVGKHGVAAGIEAFRWTGSEGMVGLGDLAGGAVLSAAADATADGSVIVGHSTTDSGSQAFVWDSTNGMRDLQSVLVSDHGLDLVDWRLTEATGISDDGNTIVGTGINPRGETEGWVASLTGGATGAWAAPRINVADMGDPDDGEGSVYGSLQRYVFSIAGRPSDPGFNAVDVKVTATSDEVHQVWAFLAGLATPDEFAAAFVNPNEEADSHAIRGGTAADPLFELVLSNSENRTGAGSSPLAALGGGFGNDASLEAGVITGNEQGSYDVYQLVLPDEMVGTVTIEILATWPGLDAPFARTFVFDNTHAPSAGVDIIGPSGSVDGGSGATTGVDFEFENVTVPGVFTSEFSEVTEEEIAGLGQGFVDSIDFAFPSGPFQIWDLDFTGEFDGLVKLVFAYDYTTLNVPEDELFIAHQRDTGEWEILPGELDLLAHTITVYTDTFSPFALGMEGVVPEPATAWALAALAGALALRRRRR